MKRRLFTLALFLFLGPVVNVAVAWGCLIVWPYGIVVYYWGDDLHPTPALRILESLLPSEEYASRDRTIVIFDYSRLGWIEYVAHSAPGIEPTDQVLFVMVIDAGLPLKSFRSSYCKTNPEGRPSAPCKGFSHSLMIPS